ncbi:MAG TPA: AI-2E family transporter [Candidatus Binataceae bacterium]|nr:AI-2E family transporter [Candidatus Binataceae bacterium]
MEASNNQMSVEPKSAVKVQLWVVGATVALLGLGCLLILRPFISAALWAAILCFTTWPLFLRLMQIVGGRRGLAALIAMLALAATIAAPFVILGSTLASNLAELTAATQKLYESGPPAPPVWVATIPLVGARLSNYWLTLTESSAARLEELAKLLPTVKSIAVDGGKMVGSGIFQITLSLLIAFFFYRDGEAVAAQLNAGINRIGGDRGNELLDIAGATIRAVVYGIIGTALVQGALAAFGFAIAGVPGAAFLGFITFLVAMIPGGPTLVAAPAAYWLYTQGSSGWAIFIIIWGVMDSMIDNVIKPLLISRGVATPMILVMFGVFGGALAFGLIGLFIGPTVLAVAYTLLQQWGAPPAALAASAAAAPGTEATGMEAMRPQPRETGAA